MSTLGDLVTFFHNLPSSPPGLLFPDLRNKAKLPSNLSVQIPNKRKKKKRNRAPFQNYNDPKHTRFPQQEARSCLDSMKQDTVVRSKLYM